MKIDVQLRKSEILKSKKEISSVLHQRKQAKSFPILLLYKIEKSESPEVKILFSVSKKKQKLAVKRNKIKRKLREAFRRNKLSLYDHAHEEGVNLSVMCIQLSGDNFPLELIEKKLNSAINKLKLNEANEENV